MASSTRRVNTSHAELAYWDSAGEGLPVVMIHGNSASKSVFGYQFADDMARKYRLIAPDLPGHGDSEDARDPQRSYTVSGYADAVSEMLEEMGIDRAAVFGWSLGGHVALEMVERFPGVVGVMVTGTPPVGESAEEIMAGFQPSPHMAVPFTADLSEEQRGILAFIACGDPTNKDAHAAIMRTDKRAREIVFADMMAGGPANERTIVETSQTPIAIVNGESDPVVNLDYVASLAYRNLWEKHCFVLRGAGHSPFMQVPDLFNPVLGRFVGDMEQRAKTIPVVTTGRAAGVA
ncbi:MAG: alpha/beta fold hydrolase [Alphaproteobacteria bacterium]